jgi:hypothetical protein
MIRACQDCSINISNHCKKCSNNFITRIIGDRRYFLSNGNFCNNCYVQNESCCKLHLDQDEWMNNEYIITYIYINNIKFTI